MVRPPVTLMSDFGLKDPYVAEMKAVISTISPEAKVIDISHSIEKFNVRMGAFVLASAVTYFPKGTIHVAVVDPRVGTKRRPIMVQTKHAYYVGPDNGLLMLAARRDGIQSVRAVTNRKLMLSHVSSTFHGRDIFAPAAAHLANGTPPSKFGSATTDYVTPKYASPTVRNSVLKGEVLHIDDFGNIITNIMKKDLKKIGATQARTLSIKAGRKSLTTEFCRTYGEVPAKSVLTLIGSHNFLEIAVNQGNASRRLKIRAGDILTVAH